MFKQPMMATAPITAAMWRPVFRICSWAAVHCMELTILNTDHLLPCLQVAIERNGLICVWWATLISLNTSLILMDFPYPELKGWAKTLNTWGNQNSNGGRKHFPVLQMRLTYIPSILNIFLRDDSEYQKWNPRECLILLRKIKVNSQLVFVAPNEQLWRKL